MKFNLDNVMQFIGLGLAWRKCKVRRKEILSMALLVIPLTLYLLGMVAYRLRTGVFSPLPHHVLYGLFSSTGRGVITVFLLLGLVGSILIGIRKFKYHGKEKDPRNFRYSDSGVYGTARFMTEEEMLEHFNCVPEKYVEQAEGMVLAIKDGLCISRPKNSRRNRNTIVIGSSGTMKTRAIINNAILGSVRNGESMILTDPKGELFRNTAIWLRENGYTVRALNTVSMENSHSWNFLEDALQHVKEGDELLAVEQIAHVIITNTKDTTGNAHLDFWDQAERCLLRAIMLYQYYRWKSGCEPLTFSAAYEFLLNNELSEIERAINRLDSQFLYNAAKSQYNTFKKAGEKLIPNIHFGLLSRLSLFQNPGVCKITGENQMDLVMPAKEKCAYFIITPDQDSTYDFITCLFFTMFFMRVVKFADSTPEGCCPVTVNCLLDEFPNIGEIPDFAKKMATVRSRGVTLTIICQSIPQLTERYPDPLHHGILTNADFKVFLGTDDQITAEYISTRAGETTVVAETNMENMNKFNLTRFVPERRESMGDGRRMILTVDEVLMMGKYNELACLVMMRGQSVLECEKFDYERNPEVKDWKPLSLSDFDPEDSFWGAAKPPVIHTPPMAGRINAPANNQNSSGLSNTTPRALVRDMEQSPQNPEDYSFPSDVDIVNIDPSLTSINSALSKGATPQHPDAKMSRGQKDLLNLAKREAEENKRPGSSGSLPTRPKEETPAPPAPKSVTDVFSVTKKPPSEKGSTEDAAPELKTAGNPGVRSNSNGLEL